MNQLILKSAKKSNLIFKSCLFIFLILFFSYCSNSDLKNSKSTNSNAEIKIQYAKHFKIFKSSKGYNLIVKNPWQGAKDVELSYLLSNNLSDKNTIKIPVQKVICLSTTHIAFLNFLDCDSLITGISGGKYIYNSEIKERYKTGKIFEIGYDQNINFETIINNKPDIIFAYGNKSYLFAAKYD